MVFFFQHSCDMFFFVVSIPTIVRFIFLAFHHFPKAYLICILKLEHRCVYVCVFVCVRKRKKDSEMQIETKPTTTNLHASSKFNYSFEPTTNNWIHNKQRLSFWTHRAADAKVNTIWPKQLWRSSFHFWAFRNYCHTADEYVSIGCFSHSLIHTMFPWCDGGMAKRKTSIIPRYRGIKFDGINKRK